MQTRGRRKDKNEKGKGKREGREKGERERKMKKRRGRREEGEKGRRGEGEGRMKKGTLIHNYTSFTTT